TALCEAARAAEGRMARIAKGAGVLATIAALLLIAATDTVDSQPAFEQVNGRDAVAREVLIKFRNGSPSGEARSGVDAAALRAIGRAGGWRLRSRSLDVATLLSRFANRSDVAYVEPNYIVHAFTEPTDPGFPQLWGLKNIGQAVNGGLPGTAGADIHA